MRQHCSLIFPFHVHREQPTTLHVPAAGTGFDPAADLRFDGIARACGALGEASLRIPVGDALGDGVDGSIADVTTMVPAQDWATRFTELQGMLLLMFPPWAFALITKIVNIQRLSTNIHI